MKRLMFVFLAILSATSGTVVAQPSQLYAVIFEVTLGTDGKVTDLKLARVIDPATGSLDSVNVTVPEIFVSAAREKMRLRTYPTDDLHFFTYFFYDPVRPNDATIDPKSELIGS
jgi:hypothetical protein